MPHKHRYIRTRVGSSKIVWLKTGSEVDLSWLTRLLKDWAGTCKAVLEVSIRKLVCHCCDLQNRVDKKIYSICEYQFDVSRKIDWILIIDLMFPKNGIDPWVSIRYLQPRTTCVYGSLESRFWNKRLSQNPLKCSYLHRIIDNSWVCA